MADIRKVIAKMEEQTRKAFEAAIEDIRSNAQIAVIARALEEGRIDDALRALHLSEEFFAPLDDAMRAAYLEGGRDAIIGLPAIPDPFLVAAWYSDLTREIPVPKTGLPRGPLPEFARSQRISG